MTFCTGIDQSSGPSKFSSRKSLVNSPFQGDEVSLTQSSRGMSARAENLKHWDNYNNFNPVTGEQVGPKVLNLSRSSSPRPAANVITGEDVVPPTWRSCTRHVETRVHGYDIVNGAAVAQEEGRSDVSAWKPHNRPVEGFTNGVNVISGDDSNATKSWKPCMQRVESYNATHGALNTIQGVANSSATWKPHMHKVEGAREHNRQYDPLTGVDQSPNQWKPHMAKVDYKVNGYNPITGSEMNLDPSAVRSGPWKPSIRQVETVQNGFNPMTAEDTRASQAQRPIAHRVEEYQAKHEAYNMSSQSEQVPQWRPSMAENAQYREAHAGFNPMTGEETVGTKKAGIRILSEQSNGYNVMTGDDSTNAPFKPHMKPVEMFKGNSYNGYNPITGDDQKPPQWRPSFKRANSAPEDQIPISRHDAILNKLGLN